MPAIATYQLPLLLLFFILYNNTIQAQSRIVDNKMRAALQKITQDPHLKNASLGFYAASVEDDRIIVAHNADKSMIPASTLKTVTTATALSILGPDYKVQTLLQYDGKINKEGTLQGNLYIKGGGDPTLGTPRKNKAGTRYNDVRKQWVAAVKAAGIKKIEGSVIGDASVFEEAMASPKWLWEDLGNYYGAGANGLSFYENQYEVVFKSGKKTGDPTEVVRLHPDVPYLTFVNRVISKGSGDNAYIFNPPYSDLCFARGHIPPNKDAFTVKGVIPEPDLFCAFNLRDALENNGIKVSQTPTTYRRLETKGELTNFSRTTIHSLDSPTVYEIAYWTNKRSINLYAEHLLKLLGKEATGVGSLQAGLKVVENHWLSLGVDLEGFYMFDGSGLSPVNAITPRQLGMMLSLMHCDEHYDSFLQTLPVCGDTSDDGLLKSFLNTEKTAKKFWLKSGYMSRNRAYAGYFENTKGELFVCVVFLNSYACSNTKSKIRLQELLKPLVEVF